MTNIAKKKVRIGITLGDPAGIGTEIVLKALSDKQLRSKATFLLIGDYGTATHLQRQLGMKSFNFHILSDIGRLHLSDELINFINLGNITFNIPYGKIDARCGKAAYEYINMACLVLRSSNSLDALVTAPINKESLNLAGYHFQGHTQILAQRFKARYVRMMFCAEKMKIILVTIHIPLKNVAPLITRAEVQDTIFAVHRTMNTFFKIKKPLIGVCALNPHASEHGLFGTEEKDHIIPAIKKARSQKVKVEGPFPADTIFWKAKNGEFDAVIAMYHDQACIPFKTLYFDKGVNVTLGLPFIRTSPDHGTAFDIAGKNQADPTAMIEAIKLAIEMADNKPRKRKKTKVYVPHSEHTG
ncbi:MAG: 4-hydroxythreonine-4-phosphate dehydrogenase PdxA [Candidatus Omnitrophica bacterium]|nr:4-hydroxythreonine-4-phosphate dehydrogenase PdxA [Candidatus Omnitrophota bacterium]